MRINDSTELVVLKKIEHNNPEEIAYRRGFDQGVAQFAYAIGVSNMNLQQLSWKTRIRLFRTGWYDLPPQITEAEKRQIKKLLKEMDIL